ncbi:hypothetical protein ACFVFQ_04035 [Streptomyces sp. NPDC057743]|uniref:hypothetical protein n=1 Tax=Streptomyces sp. NPDC057743 TaxID=3346236 RepID=UPI0036A00F33
MVLFPRTERAYDTKDRAKRRHLRGRVTAVEIMLLRVGLAPLLVLLATVVQRRWGHAVGGRLAGLPLTSGPIVVVLAVEHGPDFAARSSAGMLLGLISGCAFCLAYAATARRCGWWVSLGAGLGVFAVGTVVFWWVRIPVLAEVVLVPVCLAVMLHWWPAGGARATSVSAWWDAPLRMACAAGVVLAITGASDALGPRLAGLLAPLQVIAAIMAVFTHRAEGGAGAVHFLRGVVQGSFAFAGFFVVLTLALPRWGAVPALLLACSLALHVQVVVAKVAAGGRRRVGGAGAAVRERPQAAPASTWDDPVPDGRVPGRQLVANQGRFSKDAG